MVPDADLQLSVSIKALREVVAPALDPANRVAAEQLHLAIVTLSMVQAGLPMQHARARSELANASALADLVVKAGAKEPTSLSAAKAALADAAKTTAALDTLRILLLDEIEGSVAATAGTPAEGAVSKAVVQGSKAQLDLARAWNKGAGFEVNPDEVPPLDGLLLK